MSPALTIVLAIILALAAILLAASLVWRRRSRRHELPCPSWLAWMVELDNPFTRVNRARFIVDHLGLEPGMRALDAGCGPGRLTIPLAEAVGPEGEVVALDLQEGMLERVRQKAAEAGLENVRTLHAALGAGALPAERFDRAVLVTVLGEIPDPAPALREIHDALRPGGLLSVTEVIFDPHFQRRETVLRAAEAAGLRQRAFLGKRLAYTLHLERPAEG
jgi:SAM-dependent methyltransferase